MVKEKEDTKKIIKESKYNESVLNKELDLLKDSNSKLSLDVEKLVQSKKDLHEEIEIAKVNIHELEEKNKVLNNKMIEKDKEIEAHNENELKMKEEFEHQKIQHKEIIDNEVEKRELLIKEMQEKVNKLSREKTMILESGKNSRKELRDAKYKILDLEKKILDVQIEMSKLKRDNILKK